MYAEKFNSFVNLINQINRGALASFLVTLSAIGQHDETDDITLDSKTEKCWLQIGGCLASLGCFEEASECYQIALEINPEATEAVYGLAGIGDFSKISHLSEGSIKDKILVNFVRGQYHDERNEYEQAFSYYKAGNDLALTQDMETISENLSKLHERVDSLIKVWTPEMIESLQGCGHMSDRPVFIVGMPRSGTTITEQIIASHSMAFGTGERTEISEAANSLGVLQPENWKKNEIRLRAMGILSHLISLGRHAIRITDKMPDNVFHVGAIQTFFPNARIIFCRRNIKDIALSCYFQNFGTSFPWSHDISAALDRANEINRLMDHWKSVLRCPTYDMDYETLVSDQEAASRRLLSFLDLEWEPECLQFHQLNRQILTASLWQVRQPIFQSSVGKWRHYQEFCDVLKTP